MRIEWTAVHIFQSKHGLWLSVFTKALNFEVFLNIWREAFRLAVPKRHILWVPQRREKELLGVHSKLPYRSRIGRALLWPNEKKKCSFSSTLAFIRYLKSTSGKVFSLWRLPFGGEARKVNSLVTGSSQQSQSESSQKCSLTELCTEPVERIKRFCQNFIQSKRNMQI